MSSATSEPLVLVSDPSEAGVVQITLNAPSSLNALTIGMGEEMQAHVERLSMECDGFGAVVLTGKGRAFSAGGDLDFLRRRHRDSPSRNAAIMRQFYQRFLSLRKLPVPVVAAINGPAIGAGLSLAMACDLRVAAASAKLGVTFVGLGLHPGMGVTHTLPHVVGQQTAARLLLTGEVVSGVEAARIGVVAEAVEGEDDGAMAVARAHELAGRMAAQAPVAVRGTLRTLRNQVDAGFEQALWREADQQAQSYASMDISNGIEAVATKSRPAFTQRERYEEDQVFTGVVSGRK